MLANRRRKRDSEQHEDEEEEDLNSQTSGERVLRRRTSKTEASSSVPESKQNGLSMLTEELSHFDGQPKPKKMVGPRTAQVQQLWQDLSKELRVQVQKNPDKLEDPAVFRIVLKNSDKLLDQAVHTSEGIQDARQMLELAQIGKNQTAVAAKANYGTVPEFLARFTSKFRTSTEDAPPGVDWRRVGGLAFRYFRGVPATNFMLGGLEIVVKEKKERAKRVVKEMSAELKMPSQVASTENDEKTATDARVQALGATLLKLREPMNFYSFLLNPESYTQSIENIFDFSFLLKLQRAELSVKDGIPYVRPKKEPSDEEIQQGNIVTTSIVTSLDYQTYVEALKKFNITRPFLDTREVRVSNRRNT